MKKKIQQLTKFLAHLKEGEGIDLAEDTFLCTGGLDGSDKIYGFTMEGGKLLVISREVSDGYPIEQMDKDDLDYMFNGSSISKKLEKKEYEVVEADEV
jgi:hypothetical protein